MRKIFLSIVIVLIVQALPLSAFCQTGSPADTFPVPGRSANQLFYLQRQPNTNTIIVDLNIKNGKVDVDDPVHVYWIRYQKGGQKAELSWIQKTFAYGIQSRKISDNFYELNFVSTKKIKFSLELGTDKVWRVFAKTNNGSKIILRRIYLHVHGGSFWKPNVEYVELKGDEPGSYKEVRERFTIQ